MSKGKVSKTIIAVVSFPLLVIAFILLVLTALSAASFLYARPAHRAFVKNVPVYPESTKIREHGYQTDIVPLPRPGRWYGDYRLNAGEDYRKVIPYFKRELPQKGWILTDEYHNSAYFVKGDSLIRVSVSCATINERGYVGSSSPPDYCVRKPEDHLVISTGYYARIPEYLGLED